MPRYTFDVILRAKADELRRAFQDANKDANNFRNNLTQNNKSINDSFSSTFKEISGTLKGIFSLEIFRALTGIFDTLLDRAKEFAGVMLDIGKGIIESNANLEQSRFATAAILNYNSEIVDAKGKQVSAETAFSYNLAKSAQLQKQFQGLAYEGIGTRAEYEEAFANLFGSVKASAKEGQDPIAETIKMADKVVAIFHTFKTQLPGGLAEATRQMNEILTGNPRAQNKTAQLLGFKNEEGKEQLKTWLAQGDMLNQINKKMVSFSTMSQFAQNTWDGLTSSIGDVKELVDAMIGGDAFKQIEGFLLKVRDSLAYVGSDKILRLQPWLQQVVDTTKQIFTGSWNSLQRLVESMINLAQNNPRVFNELGELANESVVTLVDALIYFLQYLEAHSEDIIQFLRDVRGFVLSIRQEMESMIGIAGDLIDAVGKGAKFISSIPGGITNVLDNPDQAISNAATGFGEAASDIVYGTNIGQLRAGSSKITDDLNKRAQADRMKKYSDAVRIEGGSGLFSNIPTPKIDMGKYKQVFKTGGNLPKDDLNGIEALQFIASQFKKGKGAPGISLSDATDVVKGDRHSKDMIELTINVATDGKTKKGPKVLLRKEDEPFFKQYVEEIQASALKGDSIAQSATLRQAKGHLRK